MVEVVKVAGWVVVVVMGVHWEVPEVGGGWVVEMVMEEDLVVVVAMGVGWVVVAVMGVGWEVTGVGWVMGEGMEVG